MICLCCRTYCRFRTLSFVGTLLLCGTLAGVSETVYAQGGGAGAFSRLGFDARGVAQGNALVASSASDVSPYYNPALLPAVSGQRVSGSTAVLAYDRQWQSLEFTTPLGPTAGVGVGLIHGGVRDIDGRTPDGTHTEMLSTDEYAVSVSFGNEFTDHLRLGVNLTLYQSDLVPDANPVRGFGVDLGVTYRLSPRLQVAGAVTDLLAKYDWSSSSTGGRGHVDRFPLRIRVGGSYVLREGRVRLMAEVESRFADRGRREIDAVVTTTRGPRRQVRTERYVLHTVMARIGGTYRPVKILSLRAGLDRIGTGDAEGLRPSAGFGVHQDIGDLKLRLSYAAAMEPYVRTFMNFGTLEVFL